MRKPRKSDNSSNPNCIPVSPKRGLAPSGPSLQRPPVQANNGGADVEALARKSQHITIASNRAPPSSAPSQHQTRASGSGPPISLPSDQEIRNKRQWTVVRILGQSDSGREVDVHWKDTTVPAKSIRLDEKEKAYVKACGMRHYIAEKSRGECDARGKVLWNCKWEPSRIPKEWMKDVEVESVSVGSSEAAETPNQSPLPILPSSPSLPAVQEQVSVDQHRTTSTGRQRTRKARASSVSTIDFDDQPKAKLQNYEDLQFAVANDTLNYGPAVQKLITAQLGKKLITTTNKPPPIVKRRVKKHAVRPLFFKDWVVGRGRHKINLQDHQNAEAVLVHMQGYDVVNPCTRCEQGRGVFQGCVVGDDFGRGECTNCHYGSKSTLCSFRKDTVADGGHRPAVVVKRKSTKKQKAKSRQPSKARLATERPATPIPTASTDFNQNLHFSERNFVHSGGKSSSTALASSSTDPFVVSGGLGELTASPTALPKRPRSHLSTSSSASSSGDDVEFTKRPKVDVIDLTSSPEKPKTPRKKMRTSPSPVDRPRKRDKGKQPVRPSGKWTPSSSPPLLSRVGVGASQSGSFRMSKAASGVSGELAVASQEIPTSGSATTSSLERLRQRKHTQMKTGGLSSSVSSEERSFVAAQSGSAAAATSNHASGSSLPKTKTKTMTGARGSEDSGFFSSGSGPTKVPSKQRQQISCTAGPSSHGGKSQSSIPFDQLSTPAALHSASNPIYRGDPPITLPSPTNQTPVHASEHFARHALSPAQFAYLWHRSDAATQDVLARLLRWARLEGLVPRAMGLAEFYSVRDEARGWLNGVVVPRVGAGGLRGDGGGEGVSGGEESSTDGTGSDDSWSGSGSESGDETTDGEGSSGSYSSGED